MSEDKKLKKEFCVVLNISFNLEEKKLLFRYKSQYPHLKA